MNLWLGALLSGLVYTVSAFLVPPQPTQNANSSQVFDWADIPSSKHLKYHQCYEHFECARLEVPLDWTDPSNPNTVTIAVARLPAVVGPEDDSFGGTIVINPGGPSGSGVGILVWSGRSIQKVVDSDKHFEILSFDPRGVQFSTPNVACFQDDKVRETISLLAAGAGSFESNQHATDVMWSIDKSIGLLCAQANNGRYPDGSNIRQFVSTASVAYDMVAIIDQVDAHRQDQLSFHQAPFNKQQAAFLKEAASGPPLLNYWGLSYGTYLGNTFASMFPERIGRMVLDGVVDAPDYTATGWTTNLQDNNKTWEKFFEYCFEAGEKCDLFEPSIHGPKQLQTKVETWLAELKQDPLPLVENGNAYILTYLNMKTLIHIHLYQPIPLWPSLALLTRALMERDLKGAIAALSTTSPDGWSLPQNREFRPFLPRLPDMPGILSENSLQAEVPIPIQYSWQQEAAVTILCGDGDNITSRTKDDFAEYLALLESQSPLVGSIWAAITLSCIHWRESSRPAERNRFTGPFQSNLTQYDPRASPLLFIGNTADPVTPVRNAIKMAQSHEGSVVLTQDMPGHCAGSSNPSVCTFGILKAFFGNGTLPEPGLVCEAAVKPWGL